MSDKLLKGFKKLGVPRVHELAELFDVVVGDQDDKGSILRRLLAVVALPKLLSVLTVPELRLASSRLGIDKRGAADGMRQRIIAHAETVADKGPPRPP